MAVATGKGKSLKWCIADAPPFIRSADAKPMPGLRIYAPRGKNRTSRKNNLPKEVVRNRGGPKGPFPSPLNVP